MTEQIKCSNLTEKIEDLFTDIFQDADLDSLDGFYEDEFVHSNTDTIINYFKEALASLQQTLKACKPYLEQLKNQKIAKKAELGTDYNLPMSITKIKAELETQIADINKLLEEIEGVE